MSEVVEQIRTRAEELAERMQSDAEFLTQVRQDPENMLVAAGLPAGVVPDFLSEPHPSFWLPDCITSCIGLSFITTR